MIRNVVGFVTLLPSRETPPYLYRNTAAIPCDLAGLGVHWRSRRGALAGISTSIRNRRGSKLGGTNSFWIPSWDQLISAHRRAKIPA